MKLAYGFIETRGLTAAIEAADAMVKAAKVSIIKQQKIGGALVTILVEGELGACQSAVAAGSAATKDPTRAPPCNEASSTAKNFISNA